MTLPTFNPPVAPSPGTADKPEINLLEAEFGDGYSQPTPNGLNHIRRVLRLTWDVLTPDQAESILSFFRARGGSKPFLYTPRDEATPVAWTCREWRDQSITGGLLTVSATLRQSFGAAA
jgi:phage-related protein